MGRWILKNRFLIGLISIIMVTGLVTFGVIHYIQTSKEPSKSSVNKSNNDKNDLSDVQSSSSSNTSSGEFASWNQKCPETLVVINRDNPLNRSMSIVNWNSSRLVNKNAK